MIFSCYFIEFWTSDLGDENLRNHKILLYYYFSFDIQYIGEKKILQQLLRGRCKGGTLVFKSIADSAIKKIFCHAMTICSIFEKGSVFTLLSLQSVKTSWNKMNNIKFLNEPELIVVFHFTKLYQFQYLVFEYQWVPLCNSKRTQF